MEPAGDSGNGAVVPLRVRVWIALAITVLWSCSQIAGIVALYRGIAWQPDPLLGFIMLGCSAAIFGSGFAKGIHR